MNREDFIISVFCLVSDWMKKSNLKLRQRGPRPALGDDEVLTMEIVGEFFGIDTDKGIHGYFSSHWLHFFPSIGDRSAFARHSANLWKIKLDLQKYLAGKLRAFSDDFHIVDGFPIPLCNFRRANFSKLFKGEASYGYCAAKNKTYYGFKGHLLISLEGVITGITITGANVDEREAALDFADEIQGFLLGDKGYLGKKAEFSKYGIKLETPLRSNMKDSRPFWGIRLINNKRRKVETVIGQLTERFNIQKIRARDLWHLSSRIGRKILAHTVGVFLNRERKKPHLGFADLLCNA